MVELAGTRVLALLTRAPSSGGKSRLFAELGMAPDPRLLEALLLDTIAGAAAPGVQLVVAVTPASACDEVRRTLDAQLPTGTIADVIAQAEGDLGERMRATMAALFARGASAVALIGSDLPLINPAIVIAAFDRVTDDRDAVVLGPAGDGGYYLVAASRVPDVFDGIEWGSTRVLEQTRDAARARALHVHLLPGMDDVDTAADLRRAVDSGRARRTAAWANSFMQ